MMTRTLFAPALVFIATLLPAAPAVPLANLVDDKTLFAVSVTDTPALLKGWDSGPIAATWSDPQIVKFLAPMRTELKVDSWDDETKAATGLTVRELLALAEGEALFAVQSFDIALIESKSPPPLLIALEVGKQGAKIEKIMADAAAKNSGKVETETFSGVKVNLTPIGKPDANDAASAAASEPDVVAWAIVDGVWLLAPQKETVFAAIDALQQGGHVSALGKSERFLRTRQRIGDAQSLAYINFPAIYPLIEQAVAAAKAKSAGQPNMMGIDPETVFAALGLDELGEVYLAMASGENETRIDSGIAYNGERGLMKILAYEPGAAPRPEWIPAKWPSVSTARFSLPKAYEGIEELLEAISPMLSGMAQGQIRGLNKQLGVDLKRDLIGSLGDELISAYAVPAGFTGGSVPSWTEMDQLVAFSLVNEAAFIKAVDALKLLAGPAADQMFLKREYLGQTLYTVNMPAGPDGKAARGFTYAVANRTLLIGIGSPATVENVLQLMAAPSKENFWDRADVKTALADAPAQASMVQVQDLAVMMKSFVELAVQLQTDADATQDPDAEKKTYVDVNARPDDETIERYWGLSAGQGERTSEGLFSTARIAHPKK
jgi:hypothetical protein